MCPLRRRIALPLLSPCANVTKKHGETPHPAHVPTKLARTRPQGPEHPESNRQRGQFPIIDSEEVEGQPKPIMLTHPGARGGRSKRGEGGCHLGGCGTGLWRQPSNPATPSARRSRKPRSTTPKVTSLNFKKSERHPQTMPLTFRTARPDSEQCARGKRARLAERAPAANCPTTAHHCVHSGATRL